MSSLWASRQDDGIREERAVFRSRLAVRTLKTTVWDRATLFASVLVILQGEGGILTRGYTLSGYQSYTASMPFPLIWVSIEK